MQGTIKVKDYNICPGHLTTMPPSFEFENTSVVMFLSCFLCSTWIITPMEKPCWMLLRHHLFALWMPLALFLCLLVLIALWILEIWCLIVYRSLPGLLTVLWIWSFALWTLFWVILQHSDPNNLSESSLSHKAIVNMAMLTLLLLLLFWANNNHKCH